MSGMCHLAHLPTIILRFHCLRCLRFGLSIVELAIQDSLSLYSLLESQLFGRTLFLSSLRTYPNRSSAPSLGWPEQRKRTQSGMFF